MRCRIGCAKFWVAVVVAVLEEVAPTAVAEHYWVGYIVASHISQLTSNILTIMMRKTPQRTWIGGNEDQLWEVTAGEIFLHPIPLLLNVAFGD